ncbi:MAG: glycosyltransferase family 4 protein [Lachnospiraceae bacterium]|nr:glycosyltransferase family 4 protein [Lachnospiraceae bacterium]
MKAVIFGTGMVYQRYKSFFLNVKILCFLDNDKNKWKTQIDGISIVAPDKIHDYEYDYIFLMSIHFKEMRKQLVQLGVPADKIIDQCHLGPFKYINQIRRYEVRNREKAYKKGKILLVSHAFNLSGAPVVLCWLAQILYKEGFSVEICAQDSGNTENLLYQMIKQGITISLCSQIDLLDIDKVCSNYDLIIVNTVTLYSIVQELSGKVIPVIWWLHEEEDVYRDRGIALQEIKTGENIHAYAVGERAREAYSRYSTESSVDIMLYGMEEIQGSGIKKVHREKLIFALIGYGCERKGQDIVYEAVSRNFSKWNNQIEIWFIGEISESQQKIYERFSCFRCMGVLDQNYIREVYDKIDILLCPSLHDPMPVVVTEAMMHKKVCIVSDMTGQYEYILPYVNGLICEAGNVKSLELAIQWTIDNREKLDAIGKEGYKIYKKYFSAESFKRKVDEIITKYLT